MSEKSWLSPFVHWLEQGTRYTLDALSRANQSLAERAIPEFRRQSVEALRTKQTSTEKK